MQTRKLGQTDLDVSLICLGTMTFGEQNTEAEAWQQLDYAVDQGVNFIDTAEMYPVPPKADTQGRTEQYIGSWLANRGKRDDVIIATKIIGPGFDYVRGGGRLSRAHILQAVDTSLARLQTDYIDLYQLHWPERPTNYFGTLGYSHHENPDAVAIEESLSAMNELVQAGKIRHVGISNETPWGVAEYLRHSTANNWPRPVSIQNPYNLLNRSFEVGLAEFSHREQVGLLAYSPLAFGMLTGKYANGAKPEGARLSMWKRFGRYNSELGQATTQRYVDLAEQHGLDAAQMALAYVNSRSFVTSNIIGATTMQQLQSNIASAELTLSKEVLAGIEAIHAEVSNPCP